MQRAHLIRALRETRDRLGLLLPEHVLQKAERDESSKGVLPLPLPSEVHTEEVVEPSVVGVEVLLQPLPGRRVHLLLVLATFLAELPSFGFPVLPVGQAEEIWDRLEGLSRMLGEVLGLEHEHLLVAKRLRPAQELVHVDTP